MGEGVRAQKHRDVCMMEPLPPGESNGDGGDEQVQAPASGSYAAPGADHAAAYGQYPPGYESYDPYATTDPYSAYYYSAAYTGRASVDCRLTACMQSCVWNLT